MLLLIFPYSALLLLMPVAHFLKAADSMMVAMYQQGHKASPEPRGLLSMLQVVLVPSLWVWQYCALFLRHLFCSAPRYVQGLFATDSFAALLLLSHDKPCLANAVHRQQRDEHACKRKYGADWDKYQAIVKCRLIPFVY